MKACKNCSAQLQPEQRFCTQCGNLIDANEENTGRIECETHPDAQAIGICVVCNKPVCTQCEVKCNGKILCDDPEHKVLLEEWSELHQSNSEYETMALVRNLADGGILAKTFSLHDHCALYWTNQSRVSLFVKKTDEETAKKLLHELNLI